MLDRLAIERSDPKDLTAVLEIYGRAFPEEELRPLVREIFATPQGVLSLTAQLDGVVVGHIAFTDCGVTGAPEARVSLLGPLAVHPERHRQGIGSALQKAGFEHLTALGIGWVCVFGDPAYYCRLGFEAETGITTPYPIPAEWATGWQSLSLGEPRPAIFGQLIVPKLWQKPELWGG